MIVLGGTCFNNSCLPYLLIISSKLSPKYDFKSSPSLNANLSAYLAKYAL